MRPAENPPHFATYELHTLILETTHETRTGAVWVKDFMPLRDRKARIIRLVEGLWGKVAMRGELALRFDYGQAVPWVTRTEDGLKALAGPDSARLHTTAPLEGKDLRTVSSHFAGCGSLQPSPHGKEAAPRGSGRR